MLDTVSKRYATALFEIALAKGMVEEFDAQAEVLERLFDDREVVSFFQSPRIAEQVKKGAIDKALGNQADPAVVNLLKLLVDKRRIGQTASIMRYFDLLTDVHRGVEEVAIVSAVELGENQLREIVDSLKRFSEYGDLRVKTEVDPGILGGIKVKLGSNIVIDGSLSNRLKEMRQQLLHYEHRGTGA